MPGGLDAFAETFVTDRTGRERLPLDEIQAVGDPVFSPDGRNVAVTLFTEGKWEVGVYDLARQALNRITAVGENMRPAWTPDGARLTYLSDASGLFTYYSINSDGSGSPERLLSTEQALDFESAAWSPDGDHLVYAASSEETGQDLWILSPGREGSPRRLLDTTADETRAVFSPDGRFIVHESAAPGAIETDIVVRPFPAVGERQWRIAAGSHPLWSADRSEILYVTDDGVSSVAVETDAEVGALTIGRPRAVVDMPGIDSFDLSPGGERLAIHRLPLESATREIRVVVNWHRELLERVPVP